MDNRIRGRDGSEPAEPLSASGGWPSHGGATEQCRRDVAAVVAMAMRGSVRARPAAENAAFAQIDGWRRADCFCIIFYRGVSFGQPLPAADCVIAAPAGRNGISNETVGTPTLVRCHRST
jgi:hypothetical protein